MSREFLYFLLALQRYLNSENVDSNALLNAKLSFFRRAPSVDIFKPGQRSALSIKAIYHIKMIEHFHWSISSYAQI